MKFVIVRKPIIVTEIRDFKKYSGVKSMKAIISSKSQMLKVARFRRSD